MGNTGNAKRLLGGMCLSLVLVACGGEGGDGDSPLQPSTAGGSGGSGGSGGNPPPPNSPPPTSPPPTSPPPPQAATDLEPAWRTTQGTASHTGYVPLHVGRAEPVVAWEWPDAADGTSLPAINPVVTGNGSVYVATESYYCAATLYALDGLSGAVRWTKEFPEACSFNPPAFGGDRLYLVSTGDEGAESTRESDFGRVLSAVARAERYREGPLDYAERHDYSLPEILHGRAEAGDITPEPPVLAAVGVNPANATTVVARRSAP